jgi:hypothetical protein
VTLALEHTLSRMAAREPAKGPLVVTGSFRLPPVTAVEAAVHQAPPPTSPPASLQASQRRHAPHITSVRAVDIVSSTDLPRRPDPVLRAAMQVSKSVATVEPPSRPRLEAASDAGPPPSTEIDEPTEMLFVGHLEERAWGAPPAVGGEMPFHAKRKPPPAVMTTTMGATEATAVRTSSDFPKALGQPLPGRFLQHSAAPQATTTTTTTRPHETLRLRPETQSLRSVPVALVERELPSESLVTQVVEQESKEAPLIMSQWTVHDVSSQSLSRWPAASVEMKSVVEETARPRSEAPVKRKKKQRRESPPMVDEWPDLTLQPKPSSLSRAYPLLAATLESTLSRSVASRQGSVTGPRDMQSSPVRTQLHGGPSRGESRSPPRRRPPPEPVLHPVTLSVPLRPKQDALKTVQLHPLSQSVKSHGGLPLKTVPTVPVSFRVLPPSRVEPEPFVWPGDVVVPAKQHSPLPPRRAEVPRPLSPLGPFPIPPDEFEEEFHPAPPEVKSPPPSPSPEPPRAQLPVPSPVRGFDPAPSAQVRALQARAMLRGHVSSAPLLPSLQNTSLGTSLGLGRDPRSSVALVPLKPSEDAVLDPTRAVEALNRVMEHRGSGPAPHRRGRKKRRRVRVSQEHQVQYTVSLKLLSPDRPMDGLGGLLLPPKSIHTVSQAALASPAAALPERESKSASSTMRLPKRRPAIGASVPVASMDMLLPSFMPIPGSGSGSNEVMVVE